MQRTREDSTSFANAPSRALSTDRVARPTESVTVCVEAATPSARMHRLRRR